MSMQTNFIKSLSDYAQELGKQYGLYASVMIAQAILESNWGKSSLSKAPNYNLFGIKGSYNGNSVTMPTSEYSGGKWIKVNAKFRKYPSFKGSLEDNAKLLKNGLSTNKNFYSGTWKSNAKSYQNATMALTGKYATDPKYNTKLNSLIKTYGLDKYDTGTPSKATNTNKPSNVKTYVVKSGDTLSQIAVDHKTTQANLLKLNPSIKNADKIQVGQKIMLASTAKKATSSTKNYKVKSGDALSVIASRNKTTTAKIMKLNPSIKNPDKIYVGQTIKLPK